MKTNDFSYYIERYNAGEMSETEKQWFEKEIDGNEKLRNEVNLRKRTDEILKNQNVMSLRNKLSEIEKKRSEQSAAVDKFRIPVYIRYAAVIAALVLIGSLVIFPGKSLSNDEIMNQFYKTYEPALNQRSANSNADADFTLALEYYNTHDYNNAAKLFSKVIEKKPNDMQSVLLNGVSNFEDKKYPEAKQSFGKVIDNKNNLYIDQAQWYLALCYINTNEKDKAQRLLTIISKEDGVYKNDAKKIIRKLK
jgi:tetratricopeptide (TPR) repeat protein